MVHVVFKYPICFILMLIVIPAQGHSDKNYWEDQLSLNPTPSMAKDTLPLYPEQVVLHMANTAYDRDLIFFKSYVFSAFDIRNKDVSDVLIVELLDADDKVLKKQFHKIENSQVNGSMQLEKSLDPGNYMLRAYTKRMKNYRESYATQSLVIGTGAERVVENRGSILKVVPEAGVLINGYENRLVIKLTDTNTMGNGSIGHVVDEDNNRVAEVYKYSDCLAATILKPKGSKNYFIALSNEPRYPIPLISNSGYQLQVNNVDTDQINLKVRVTPDLLDREVKLVATMGGYPFLETPLKFKNDYELNVQLNKENFPNGIFNLEIVDTSNHRLAARPFMINQNPLSLRATFVAADKQQRMIKLKVTDASGNPVQTKLSVSVNPSEDKGIPSGTSCDESDVFQLFAEQEEGGFNSIKEERKRLFLDDLNIQLIASDFKPLNEKEIAEVQHGLDFKGYAYDLNNTILPNTMIQVLGMSKAQPIVLETETDAQGLLVLNNLDIVGESELVFRTKGNDTKDRLVKVKQVTETRERIPSNLEAPSDSTIEINGVPSSRTGQLIEYTNHERLVELEEVEVTDKKIDTYYNPSNYSLPITSSQKWVNYQDYERPKTIEMLLAEFNGVMVKDMGGLNPSVSMPSRAGAGPILYVIDGIILSQERATLSGLTPLAEVMSMVPAHDIHKIELLLGADAAIFGSRGSGGAIVISTRNGSEYDFINRKEGKINFRGYEPEIDFESYYTEISKRDRKQLNLVYWNPSLETDENGEALITLKPSHDLTNLTIRAYTVTPQGNLGKLTKNVVVQKGD